MSKLKCGCGHDRDVHYAGGRGHRSQVCSVKGCRCVNFEEDREFTMQQSNASSRGGRDGTN
jgi:hypothetical protein